MTINLQLPDATELKPRITVFGVGGAGGNAVNNMIECKLEGVEFVVANTDAQALSQSGAERRVQMGTALTEGLGAGSQPEIGAAAAEEALPEIIDHLSGAHMVFITAGMGGGTGTGAAPVIAKAARELGILTVGVVTKPFQFEGQRRMETAERGIAQLAAHVDTLIVIPNQNLFRIANEKTTFADAFAMADQVLYSGVAGITDLMVKEGLINLDFADVRSIMSEMGKAMMGTGEASGEKRAHEAAEAAIANPLLDDVSMKGAKGLLISITGGNDLTLYEVDEAATRIREEVDKEANIILGATFDQTLEGMIRVSVVATGIAQDTFVTMPELMEADHSPMAKKRAAYVINERPDFQPARKPAAKAAEMDDEPEAERAPEVARAPEPAPRSTEFAAPVESEEVVDAQEAESNHPDYMVPAAEREAPRGDKEPAAAKPPAQRAAVAGGAPRMPEVEDFPAVAVREIRAQRGERPELGIEAHKKKAGFLERLANVGLGKKDSVVTASDEQREPVMTTQFGADDRSRSEPRADDQAPAKGQGAAAARNVDPAYDDDQLEIPAFLRRQAN